ncbi:General stress protein 69 [Cronobacter universalis NCTC 9529]|uniref:General stress protein 69 n=1 Tax=Cronobacter universalis NCTC 9529 TaxID=1074000 RepID=A0ABY1W302_9ENTR|nr:General stress protein 69 [Cronobacter universalis NCTC 9529]
MFVSELCLGTMTLGGNADAGMWSSIGAVAQEEANQLIAQALAGGINFIDTADIYSFGQSERITGIALKALGVARSDIVLATKTGGVMGKGPNDRGASRGHIMDSVQRSLERLQVDHIDLYQIHASDSVTPVEETLRALDDLTRQGLVRYVGVSNWAAGRLGKALGLSEALHATRFETLQAYYSIASRDVERELVPLVNEEKLGLLVWSPLAGGLLSGKFGPGAPQHIRFPACRPRPGLAMRRRNAGYRRGACGIGQPDSARLASCPPRGHQRHYRGKTAGAAHR